VKVYEMLPTRPAILLATLVALTTAVTVVYAEPEPGDIFREYLWKGPFGNASGWQRVTDPEARHSGAQAFLPNRVNHIEIDDFAGVLRAEIYIELWGGHAGTSNKRVRVNGNDWIEIRVPPAIPGEAGVNSCPEGYQYFTYPSVPIPLDQLHPGDNTFEFTSGPQTCFDFGWGQWGVYGVTFRLFYDDTKAHADGRIASPPPHTVFGDSLELRLTSTDPSIAQVDFIGRYRDFDFEGNGVYHQWHYNYRYGKITRHLGTINEAPFALTWRTDWIPDQDRPLQIVARIRNTDGLYYMTDVVDDLILTRPDRSVVLYEPYDVPGRWQTRSGNARQDNQVFIPHDLHRAAAAQLILATWSGGHADSIGINDRQVVRRVGWTHDYSFDEIPAPLELLRVGTNDLFTAAGTSHHGIEVLWPGIALKVQYDGPANVAATVAGPMVFADSLANGWRLAAASQVVVNLGATEKTYQGQLAVELQSGTQGWEITLARDVPLDVSRYKSIRMAVLFEDVSISDPHWFKLFVDNYFPQSLLTADGATDGVELDRAGWQIVDIPLAEFGLRRPYIESLRMRGRFSGRLLIDDFHLVPHPTTHVEADAPPRPAATGLLANYPNPFNAATVISFALAQGDVVDLSIHNLEGQRVATLLKSTRQAGSHTVRWDGRDLQGRLLATGLYLARLQTGAEATTRKLLLLR
jgi:hypothetical protein